MDVEKLWRSVLAELQLSISEANFKGWFAKSKAISLEEKGGVQLLTISAQSYYAKDMIETRHGGQVLAILEGLIKGKVNIIVTVASQKAESKPMGPLFEEVDDRQGRDLEQVGRKAQLNPSYTFDNFIVGASNSLAHAAAQAVAKASGRIHNPLFIYGGVGCGKTHLMHAIGNAIIKHDAKAQALYVSCEQFTNDLIESLKAKTTEKFRSKYRKLTLLLIDDIQFISRTEYSQEEFFNTFNALYNLNHQIVIASDRLPEEIPKLASRLTSRFQGGVIVDVSSPDLEMRIAILRAKSQEFGLLLPDDASLFIAETYKDNTRELEGALKRVIAAAASRQDPVSLEFVQTILGATKRELKRRLTPRQIVEAVSAHFDISMRDITGTKRRHEIVIARQVAMYLLRDKLNLQYERIADVLGGKDHTTVMYSVRQVEKYLENPGEMRGRIEEIMEHLGRA